jgi:hypothetical protein
MSADIFEKKGTALFQSNFEMGIHLGIGVASERGASLSLRHRQKK